MDVHTIGYIGTWVALATLIATVPFGLWGLAFFEVPIKSGDR